MKGWTFESECEVIVIFFFFFKQKTAYEILTCDWSSDVCSSDLAQIANVFTSILQSVTQGDELNAIKAARRSLKISTDRKSVV